MLKPKIDNLPQLDLTLIQRESYQWFLKNGIAESLQEISPIEDFTGKNWLLEFGKHLIGKPKYTPSQALEKGLTYDFPLRAQTTLTNKQTGERVEQEVFLGDLPAMTEQGTFVINGIERCVVNQLVRSPGVFFTGEPDPITGRMLFLAELRPVHGSWLEFNVNRNDFLTVRIDRRRKFPMTVFLRAIGLSSDEEILKTFNSPLIKNTLEHDTTQMQEEAILEIYRKMRPGEPIILDNAKAFFENLFFNGRRYDLGRAGRYKLNKKLGLNVPNIKENYILIKEDIIATITYLIKLQNQDKEVSVDDIDHLANRRVRSVGELVTNSAFRIGLLRLERTIKEKMSLAQTSAPLAPSSVINARPVIAAINDFFRTSQLSTILDQTNPLSEIDNLRRLTVMGTGGISRERASFSIRDINASQYGRICPVRSPEGPNIGLVTYLALYARVNEYGFLETPYRKVVVKNGKARITEEIIYLSADDEQKYYITHSGVKTSDDGIILEERVPARFNGEFLEVFKEQIQLIDLSPRQVVGAAASLIPFLANDEANRALMGTHMQCQAVPLITATAPIVGTGMEKAVVEAMGRTVRARHKGKVIFVDSQKIILKLSEKPSLTDNSSQFDSYGGYFENIKIEGDQEIYRLEKFKRSVQSTCYSQKPLVNLGQMVNKGDLLIDGPASDHGELALGQNMTIAYMSYDGLGFEDAIVVSDRLVCEDILTSINIEEYEASVVDTKLGVEETTRDIPNVGEEALLNLDSEGIVIIGAEVGPNDILVGKIAPKGETELTAEERLLRAIFGEKAREVRDTSLRMPHGEKGIVIDIKILDKEKGDELEPGNNRKIIIKVAQIRKVVVGDKLAGRHGNKGIISKIVPRADMPYLPDGTLVDIIISPLSVLSRMNLGQLFEAHLGWAASKLGKKIIVPVFEKVSEEKIFAEFSKANLPVSGKTVLFDGRTGQPFEREIVVGTGYFMKLIHMVEDKTHARSTGPYSLVTQQPLGGKAQMGGQRLGEMEVWALEAHRAAHILQEMLTIKSDDVVGRARAFEAIIKGMDIPASTVPESFKVLVKELQALGLDVLPQGVITSPMKIEIVDFSSLRVILASPEAIKAWSHGEVTKPETINYRTLKPEKDGLFDERIFGPTKDWECYCGKYKRIRYRGIVCDKCGVEVTQSKVRRERMGHIVLATPVIHVWFFKGAPSRLSLLLDLSPRALENVIYFASYLVLDVDEQAKKEAFKKLAEALQSRVGELKNKYQVLLREIQENLKEQIKETKEKIKNKEHQELTVAELELKVKQALTKLNEDLILDQEKTEEVFKALADLVKGLKRLSLLSEDEYLKLREYGIASFFRVGMGAEAILEMVEKVELAKLAASLREEVQKTTGQRHLKATKRLRVVDGLRKAGISASWMILKLLPVLPPDLRPMVQLSGGRFATSDLNDLYRRVINRNNRLKHLINLGAPEIILRNEKRMLQEAVDSLIDAPQKQVNRPQFAPLRSLSDMLRGKQGRFRQNLLGKRVDYSGRSVIIVGPELSLTSCGLPKEMALEMFKPFVLRELIVRGLATNVKNAKNILERRDPSVFDILEDITKNHPVLLNRAPTLHKLGIQAFYPILIEGSAIKIHPCVCAGYNADFDGDQMAVHIPLSAAACEEAKALMLPTNNLLKPADGSPITLPNKEMALGCYSLTSIIDLTTPEDQLRTYASPQEAVLAYQVGKLSLRKTILVKWEEKILKTSVGRILFNEVLPMGLRFINEPIKALMIKALITKALQFYTSEEVVRLVDEIKNLGFWAATLSGGVSVSVFDCQIIPQKQEMINQAEEKITAVENNFRQGLITNEEKKRLSNQIWIEITEKIADKTWVNLDVENPVRVIVESGGARASKDQLKQLAAMRGLVVDPLGKIVEMPTKSNFREGLSIFEYVTSTRGSRKGLTDSALKTADAGYLTRRLVDTSHDMIIRLVDCGTKEGVEILAEDNRQATFSQRILGRIAAVKILNPKTKKVIVKEGEEINEENFSLLEAFKVEKVVVRSPLTCRAKYGLCVNCYGRDFSTRKKVEIGTPVGVLAAQSIGEPGTQLTMRVKHAGGIVGLDVTQGLPRVEELFESRTPKALSPISEISGKAEVVETADGYKIKIRTRAKPIEEREYLVPLTSELKVKDGGEVNAGEQLTSGYLDLKEVLEVRGLRGAQVYLISEIQAVYESQGIPINDKHFEVIVRKMSDKVKIDSQGDTVLLPGEMVDRIRFEEENTKVLAEGGEPATAHIVILGITRAALYTESWLSAASFQETTNILTEAASLAKVDKLIGLKENVIIGRLIPTSPERATMDQS